MESVNLTSDDIERTKSKYKKIAFGSFLVPVLFLGCFLYQFSDSGVTQVLNGDYGLGVIVSLFIILPIYFTYKNVRLHKLGDTKTKKVGYLTIKQKISNGSNHFLVTDNADFTTIKVNKKLFDNIEENSSVYLEIIPKNQTILKVMSNNIDLTPLYSL